MKLKKNSMKLMCLPIAASLLLTACNKENSIQPAAQNNALRVAAVTKINDYNVYFDSNVPKDKKTEITKDVIRLYQVLLKDSIIQSMAKVPIYVTNGKTGSIAFKDSVKPGIYITNIAAYQKEVFGEWYFPLLRELIKAYHKNVLGLDYAPILKLYNEAKLNKAETTVNAKNVQEYFANAAELCFSYQAIQVDRQDPNLRSFIGKFFTKVFKTN